MNLRYATESDIDQINKLLYQVHKIHADARPDLFVKGLKKYEDFEMIDIIANREDSHVFIAEINNVVVGYAFCQAKRSMSGSRKINTLYIDDLCVDETQRGQHIGTALLEYVTTYAQKHNFYNLTLNVWALNSSAKAFYEKSGMTIQKFGMEKIL